jgi:hypothetical protein
VRLPCYMDVTTALWAAPTKRFTQQVATHDMHTAQQSLGLLEWPPSHSNSHADGCELGAVDILLIFIVYPHLCIGELLLNSLHEEERDQR